MRNGKTLFILASTWKGANQLLFSFFTIFFEEVVSKLSTSLLASNGFR